MGQAKKDRMDYEEENSNILRSNQMTSNCQQCGTEYVKNNARNFFPQEYDNNSMVHGSLIQKGFCCLCRYEVTHD